MDIPKEVVVWTFGGLGGNLRSENNYENNKGYHLKCSTNNRYLIWEKGHVGINLDFDSQPQSKFHFSLPDKKERDILCGESVAMAIGGGDAFLHYAKRTFGINLDWAKNPVNQWRIFADGVATGDPIPTGAKCAILNDKVEPDADWLVKFNHHTPGTAELGWTTSPDWQKDLTDAVKKKIKEAAKEAAKGLVEAAIG